MQKKLLDDWKRRASDLESSCKAHFMGLKEEAFAEMKIAVLGTRGFPNVQGGIEKHCEKLYPELLQRGCEVTVFSRAPYVDVNIKVYKGVKLIPLKCPRSKYFEAFIHTFSGVFAAKKIRPDILHIHAVGPSLFVSLAGTLGLKTVMTHHGRDYERKKWNWFAKAIIRWGERIGCRRAKAVICISEGIATAVHNEFARDVDVIPNGVTIPHKSLGQETLEKYGLERGKYILSVGRIVPEKGFHDLIEAFKLFQEKSPSEWKLAIAGDADHEDKYSLNLKKRAGEVRGVAITGFLSGKPLNHIYGNAGLFVLPSYYEGLPIVLLEAMSYGLSCIASDISANNEFGFEEERLFWPGDIKGLAEKIGVFINRPFNEVEKEAQTEMIKNKYDWGKIAEQTIKVYERVGCWR